MAAKTPIEWFVFQKLREKRIEHNMSQLQLSLELGFFEGYIGKVESKKLADHYNLNHLNRLAQIFKYSRRIFKRKN